MKKKIKEREDKYVLVVNLKSPPNLYSIWVGDGGNVGENLNLCPLILFITWWAGGPFIVATTN